MAPVHVAATCSRVCTMCVMLSSFTNSRLYRCNHLQDSVNPSLSALEAAADPDPYHHPVLTPITSKVMSAIFWAQDYEDYYQEIFHTVAGANGSAPLPMLFVYSPADELVPEHHVEEFIDLVHQRLPDAQNLLKVVSVLLSCVHI